MTAQVLSEAAEQCYWLCLEGNTRARAMLLAIQQEHQNRGSADLYRKALLNVVRAVVATRRRVDRSPQFQSAKLLRKLLRFIVKNTLRTGERVKEVTLGVEALGREDYDPHNDGVRTEIRRLRKALREYYSGAGLGDQIRLEIPDKKYVAIVRRMALPDITGPVSAELRRPKPSIHITPLNSLRGMSVFPAFSPGGDQIAFSWNHDSGGYNFNIFVQSIGTATPRPVTSGSTAADISPAWSPDGRQIAFLRVSIGRAEIVVTPAILPGPERKLADVFPTRYEILGRQLAWSPDGKTIAVVDKRTSDEPFRILLLSLETGTLQTLTHPPPGTIGDSDPTFLLDEKVVAFVRTEAVGIKDVFFLPPGHEKPIRLTFDRTYIYGLSWMPDQRAIIFSSTRAGIPSLWKIPIAGGEPERLPEIGERALYPAISMDGEHVAYTNVAVSSGIWELSLPGANRGGGPPKRLIYSTRNDACPDFSPDGSKVAFASDRSGAFEIWVCDRDGRSPSKLTSFESAAGAGTPRWSPDGKHIAFDCRAEGSGHVYVLTIHDGELRRLSQGNSENVVPSWSKDGESIYFSSNRTGQHQVWRMPFQGGDPVQVTRGGGFGPMESPDGEFIYYARSRTAPGLWRMSRTTREETLILDKLKPAFWGLWVATLEGIYFLDFSPTGRPPCELKFLDFRTRVVSELAILTGLNIVHYQGLAISADRQRTLYPQLEPSAGEIMLAREFR